MKQFQTSKFSFERKILNIFYIFNLIFNCELSILSERKVFQRDLNIEIDGLDWWDQLKIISLIFDIK